MAGVSDFAIRCAALAAVLWLAAGLCCPALAQETTETVDDRLASLLTEECSAAGIPGCVALISLPGGEIHTAIYGLASIEDGTPVEPGTLFRAGSITKTFVAVLALRLAADGVIDLDEPVYPYVEERTRLLRCSPNHQQVTFRHLLRHNAFIPDWIPDMPGILPWLSGLASGSGSRPGFPELDAGEPFAPGEGCRYSNTGYMVLGEALAHAGGKSLGELLGEHVFAPAGLEHTWYAAEGSTPPQADGYVLEGGRHQRVTLLDSAEVAGAAGALLCDAADLERFARALFGGGRDGAGGTLLTAEQFALMTDFAVTEKGVEYGLGLMRREIGGREALGHRGETAGYRADLLYFTDSGAVIVLLANLNEAPFEELAGRLLGELGL